MSTSVSNILSRVPSLKLNDGHAMPQLGFGIWQVQDSEVAVTEAIKVGYRSIDGAKIYENEVGLGQAIRESHVSREELFIATKLWNSDQGYEKSLKAFQESLSKLGLNYLDLYLIHWPAPRRDLYVESWKALIQLQKDGLVRSIGVSNFSSGHLKRIIDETGVTPAVNQIELHPRFQQRELAKLHREHGIVTEAWSPLGQGKLLGDSVVVEIAKRHQRTSAQVILRWHLDKGFVAIPKSVTPSRIRENFEIFDFSLSSDDQAQLDSLDHKEGRIGPNPDTATF